jgi:lysophospholipase L1-like esterase
MPTPKQTNFTKVKETVLHNAGVITQHPHIVNSELIQLKAILQTIGITSLSDMGELNISGDVIPQPGLLKPGLQIMGDRDNNTPVACTVFNKTTNTFEKKVLQATVLPAEPIPVSRNAPIGSLQTRSLMIMPDAYWVSWSLNIADDTNIVIQSPNKHLFIIAHTLIIGNNVTFTYEHIPGGAPPVPGKPGYPGDGHQGTAGTKGNVGGNGSDAPSIEIWAMTITGQFVVDLSGENGGDGGTGGAGGDGGKGAKGVDSVSRYFLGHAIDCTSGPTSGSPGIKGGKGGEGGDGGKGGNGGSLSLRAPQSVLDVIATNYINLNPGLGGQSGIPGQPGSGGEGGERGTVTGFCANSSWPDRVKGASGPAGDAAGSGLPGINGISISGNVIYTGSIEEEEFLIEWAKPAIISFTDVNGSTSVFSNKVFVGDTVYINGQNFTLSDKIRIDNTLIIPTYISSQVLSFVVPGVIGGIRDVQIEQLDGSLSNLASLFIKPTLTLPVPTLRVKPGDVLELGGTGFMPGTIIILNDDQYITDMQFTDHETISFTVVRPGSIIRNSTGEVTSIKVANAPNEYSNSIPLVLDTFKMLCFGDSIMWGQGLTEPNKFYYKAMEAISSANAGIGVYAENFAHSGAIIGYGLNNVNPAQNGEIPSSFPTIFKQHNDYKTLPDAPYIDLILMDGGVNDLGIFSYLTPHITGQQQALDAIITMANQYCFLDMKQLLLDVTTSYPQAKVIVTGYYSPVTENSFQNPGIELFLSALGVLFPITLNGLLTAAAKDSIVEQTALATTEMNNNLQLAVNAVNATLSVPRIFFAHPMFQDDNAVFATNRWLFGIDNDLTLEDEVIDARNAVCMLLPPGAGDQVFCRHASLGHPNAAGANAYFNAVLPFL